MKPNQGFGLAILFLFVVSAAGAQPVAESDSVWFSYPATDARTVALVGDFNGWAKGEDLLRRENTGTWTLLKRLPPGLFQYKFLIDGNRYELDPGNPAAVDNYNASSKNSVFCFTIDRRVLLTSSPPDAGANPLDVYPPNPGKPVYLNIIWHQHQPLYVDPENDRLNGPWVRTHATKDYYDMAAMLGQYPNVYCTINLTLSLLHQLTTYYIDRIGPFIDPVRNSIDVEGFLAKWKGRTDPWIDLALTPTSSFGDVEKGYIYKNTWNAFGISEVMIERFPEYQGLKQKLDVDRTPNRDPFTEQDMREAKFWFYLAYFDPDFFITGVDLPDGSRCDLTDLVERRDGDRFYLRKKVKEEDCWRLVVEACKVMANVIPAHRRLMHDSATGKGQIELITTPFYHPILPLIYDSDLARISQPNDLLPPRFSFPEDAFAQVGKAVRMYEKIFGNKPSGMWPGEGSVAQPVLEAFGENGITWIASDGKILEKSRPQGMPNLAPYWFPTGKRGPEGDEQGVVVVFRDTELSDRIGFKYQTYSPEEAAEDFVQALLERKPTENSPDVLVTVILDGENAWEWYRHDIDGKRFLHALYRKLGKLHGLNQIITTTTSQYLSGNPTRGIPPHPPSSLPVMEWLYPGSWINGNYDTWIGEEEENKAWEYLLQARVDLGASGIPAPNPSSDPPIQNTKEWYEYMAWEELYAAEGSDWFWWYGSDQSAPAGEKPFDDAFRLHLDNIYRFIGLSGRDVKSVPVFHPILAADNARTGQGAMARGGEEKRTVLFACDATNQPIGKPVFIVGELEVIGAWTPNKVRMFDDGTHGDVRAKDGVWSVLMEMPLRSRVEYKYTNGGVEGAWEPGDESPSRNRVIAVEQGAGVLNVRDVFGRMENE